MSVLTAGLTCWCQGNFHHTGLQGPKRIGNFIFEAFRSLNNCKPFTFWPCFSKFTSRKCQSNVSPDSKTELFPSYFLLLKICPSPTSGYEMFKMFFFCAIFLDTIAYLSCVLRLHLRQE